MNPEIARDQNYDNHYANDSEDVHRIRLRITQTVKSPSARRRGFSIRTVTAAPRRRRYPDPLGRAGPGLLSRPCIRCFPEGRADRLDRYKRSMRARQQERVLTVKLSSRQRVSCRPAPHSAKGVKVGRRSPLYRGQSSTPNHRKSARRRRGPLPAAWSPDMRRCR